MQRLGEILAAEAPADALNASFALIESIDATAAALGGDPDDPLYGLTKGRSR